MKPTDRPQPRLLSAILLLLLSLSGCTSTPIAVRTEQWHVPPVNPVQRAAENADLSAAQTSLSNFCRTEMVLPGVSPSSMPTCSLANETATH